MIWARFIILPNEFVRCNRVRRRSHPYAVEDRRCLCLIINAYADGTADTFLVERGFPADVAATIC